MAAMELGAGGESDLGSVLMGSSSTSSIFHRRIEFHPSRKAFNGFVSSSGDFKIETLNPGVYDCGRMDSGNVSPLVSGNGRKSDLELLDAWFDPELSFSASFQRIKFVFRSYMEKINRVHACLDPEFKDERGYEIERTETSSKESIRDMINDHLDTPMQIDPENVNRVWWNNEGAGLENLGNTCFLNSVLQCLTYTEPLAAYLQSGKHQNSCRINGFCALCAIQKHVSRALKANGRILAPKDLVSNLRCISRNFRNARQEDAHEYMVNLLESMHKCCLPSGVPSESPSAYDKSLVYKIFGGRLRSQVKCMQCSYGSNKFDPFIDLSLEIVKADSIVKALKHFTTSELLDGGERQYQCQRCSQKVRALKQLTVHKAPYVLTVHLKRFESHDPGQKINKNVQFDIVLDLKPFVTGSYEGELKYTLYGVLVHHGWSTHSGHYYCYVRTSTNMWYSLDDNHVRQVSESTVLQQKAYMLFYVRNRRNVALRKFVDISTNVGANKMSLVPAQSPRGPVQRGYKLANVLSPAAGATVKNTSKSSSPFKLNVSGAPVQDSLVAQKEHSTRAPLLKDLINGSGLNQNLQNHPQLGSNASHKVENALVNVRSSGTNPSSGNANSSEELVGSYTVLHTCALALEISASKKIDDETSQKMISPSTLAPLAGNSSICSSMEMPENVVAIKVGDQSSINSAQVGSIASEHVSDAPLTKEGEITKKRLTTDKREESTLLNGPLQKEAANFRPVEKIKRSLKCHVASLHLSTSILFHGSVGPRRMHRKHKSRKSKSRDRKLMESNCFPSDMEPSASGIKNSGTVSSTDSKRKRAKSSSFKEVSDPSSKQTIHSNHNSFDIMDEPRGGTSQNVAVLAACVPFEKIGCSSSNEKLDQTAGYELLNDNKRDSMQKGLMSMLTRGLEETLVSHWDGMDISPSPSFESDCTENTSIGYVLDEWDEEYDRGKRKKVRHSKHDFDGPNHFQEFASEKMKLNNSKIDKSCRYPPFRI